MSEVAATPPLNLALQGGSLLARAIVLRQQGIEVGGLLLQGLVDHPLVVDDGLGRPPQGLLEQRLQRTEGA